MNPTKIAFLVAAVFALTVTAQEASSASFNSLGALKQSAVGTNLMHSTSGVDLATRSKQRIGAALPH